MINNPDNIEVSAIVCTYNGSKLIEECIRSLLAQSFEHPYEVIVVDDGSNNDTVKMLNAINSPRLRVIEHEQNFGLSAARNTGWRSAKGTIIAYIDDDAVAPRGWLRSLYDGYDDDIDGVGGYPAEYGSSQIDRYEVSRTEITYGKQGENVEGAGGMNMSFRRSVLADIGGFDERFTHMADDADLNRRLINEGYTLHVDTSIRVYHQFPQGIANFVRKKFKRGLGPALMYRKHGGPSVGWTLVSAIVSPFLVPFCTLMGYRYWTHADHANLMWFIVLAYLDRVFTTFGTAYHLLRLEE